MSSLETLKITPLVIKKAVKMLKPSKSDVIGYYTSDVFINAPDSLFVHLSAIFQSFVIHGTMTKDPFLCFSAFI